MEFAIRRVDNTGSRTRNLKAEFAVHWRRESAQWPCDCPVSLCEEQVLPDLDPHFRGKIDE